jgi:hypothetical protein
MQKLRTIAVIGESAARNLPAAHLQEEMTRVELLRTHRGTEAAQTAREGDLP